jgi:hypothetical protein
MTDDQRNMVAHFMGQVDARSTVSTDTACRMFDCGMVELSYALQTGLPYTTVPPGYEIDFHNADVLARFRETGKVQLYSVPAGAGGMVIEHVDIAIRIVVPTADAAPDATLLDPKSPISGTLAPPTPVLPKIPTADIVFELSSRYPRGSKERMRGPDGYAQRLIKRDPRLADMDEATIANRWYEWNKLPKR